MICDIFDDPSIAGDDTKCIKQSGSRREYRIHWQFEDNSLAAQFLRGKWYRVLGKPLGGEGVGVFSARDSPFLDKPCDFWMYRLSWAV